MNLELSIEQCSCTVCTDTYMYVMYVCTCMYVCVCVWLLDINNYIRFLCGHRSLQNTLSQYIRNTNFCTTTFKTLWIDGVTILVQYNRLNMLLYILIVQYMAPTTSTLHM